MLLQYQNLRDGHLKQLVIKEGANSTCTSLTKWSHVCIFVYEANILSTNCDYNWLSLLEIWFFFE